MMKDALTAALGTDELATVLFKDKRKIRMKYCEAECLNSWSKLDSWKYHVCLFFWEGRYLVKASRECDQ